MGVSFYLKHDERIDRGKIRLISFLSFLLGFAQAIIGYVLALYFSRISGTENVSGFYAAAFLALFVIFLNTHKLVRKFGKSSLLFFSFVARIVILFAALMMPESYLTLALLVVYMIFENFSWVMLDIVLESFSSDRKSGRIRGLHLTILNLGFLLGPFLSVTLLNRFDFAGIFLFLLAVDIVVFVISLVNLRHVNHRFNADLSVSGLLKKVRKRKDILNIYYISFILEMFYALIVIYTTIYLRNLGFSLQQIGIMFTIMLVPFVLVQYPMGILADRRTGEKEFLALSIFIMGMATIAIYFIDSKSLLIWSGVLFLTRVGAALIEVLRDSYFYKRIDGHDVDLISFFRSSRSVGVILGAFLATILLVFLPVKFVFILIGILVLTALIPAIRLKDNPSESELKRV